MLKTIGGAYLLTRATMFLSHCTHKQRMVSTAAVSTTVEMIASDLGFTNINNAQTTPIMTRQPSNTIEANGIVIGHGICKDVAEVSPHIQPSFSPAQIQATIYEGKL